MIENKDEVKKDIISLFKTDPDFDYTLTPVLKELNKNILYDVISESDKEWLADIFIDIKAGNGGNVGMNLMWK